MRKYNQWKNYFKNEKIEYLKAIGMSIDEIISKYKEDLKAHMDALPSFADNKQEFENKEDLTIALRDVIAELSMLVGSHKVKNNHIKMVTDRMKNNIHVHDILNETFKLKKHWSKQRDIVANLEYIEKRLKVLTKNEKLSDGTIRLEFGYNIPSLSLPRDCVDIFESIEKYLNHNNIEY